MLDTASRKSSIGNREYLYNQSSPKVIQTLQAGRAFAALAVVISHCQLAVEGFVGSMPQMSKFIFGLGYLGVDFFFVLSGFIIYYTNQNKERTGESFVRFAQARILRIFVPYIPIALLLAGAYVFLPGLSASNRTWSWLSTLLLVPSFAPPALNVAWTLQHELIFYVIFAFAMFSFNRLWTTIYIWAGCICLSWAFGWFELRPYRYFFATVNLEFMFGLVCAYAISELRYHKERYIIIVNNLCVTLATLGFSLFFVLGAHPGHRILVGLSLAFVLLPLVFSEMKRPIRIPSWILLLGNASYSIYLIHDPLISVVIRCLAQTPFNNMGFTCLIICFCVSVAAGVIYHFVIEKPGLKYAKQLLT